MYTRGAQIQGKSSPSRLNYARWRFIFFWLSVCNLLYVTFLEPRRLRWLFNFWKCIHRLYCIYRCMYVCMCVYIYIYIYIYIHTHIHIRIHNIHTSVHRVSSVYHLRPSQYLLNALYCFRATYTNLHALLFHYKNQL